MKFPLIARNLRFFSCETDWFGDPPSRRSPWLEPLGVVGDPPWFGSKKMKRRGREMGRDGEENVWLREMGKKMRR
jgi:hypothetical protein